MGQFLRTTTKIQFDFRALGQSRQLTNLKYFVTICISTSTDKVSAPVWPKIFHKINKCYIMCLFLLWKYN